MEISEKPFDPRFQESVREIEISDPEIEKFFFDLSIEDKQTTKNILIGDKYREILGNIARYTEPEILQYASVFLKFSSSADFYAGKIMKEWQAHQDTAKKESELVSGTIQVSVSEDVSNAT
jgi:hypothetical protein